MKLDRQLFKDMEELFQESEARLVTAVQVHMQHSGSNWAVAKTSKQLKCRILCLTAKRSKTSRGFRCTLHVVKDNQREVSGSGGLPANYQVRKSWGLKYLTRMEAGRKDVQDGDTAYKLLSLTFTSTMGSGLAETKMTCAVTTEEDRMLLLACLYRLSMEQERRAPAVLNADAADLDRISRSSVATALLGEFGAELLAEDDDKTGSRSAGGAGGGGRDGGGVEDGQDNGSITSKDERDLQSLMERFRVGIGNVDEFMDRLGGELRGLEAANVYSILESEDLVRGLLKRLDTTLHQLDDLEAQMSVYNFRMQHMRADIAAIELRNNRMEIAARNCTALHSVLSSTLDHLDLPGECETVLLNAEFGNSRYLKKVVGAAWELHGTLQRLRPGHQGGLSDGLLRMRAIWERQALLSNRAHHFVQRASAFLVRHFHEIGEQFSMEECRAQFRQGTLTNSAMHSRCQELAGLLEVMEALEPSCMVKLRTEYSKAVNVIVRRQLRACANSVRAGARLAMAQAQPEADINFRRGARMSPFGSFRTRRTASSFDSFSGRNPPSLPSTPSGSPSKILKTLSGSPDRLGSFGLNPGTDVEAQSLDEAYALLLDNFVPLLLREADFAVQLLLLSKPDDDRQGRKAGEPSTSAAILSPSKSRPGKKRMHRAVSALQVGAAEEVGQQGMKAMEALLEGVDLDLLQMVDMTAKTHQQFCVPMLGATLRHQAKVAAVAYATPLHRTLTECEKRLRINLENFVTERVSNISKFEAGGAMNPGSVKHIHVAPFVSGFGPLITRLEDFLWSCKMDEPPEARPSRRGGGSQSDASEASDHGNAHSDGPSRSASENNLSESTRSRRSTADSLDTSGSGGDERLQKLRAVSIGPPIDVGLSLRARFIGTGGSGVSAATQVRNVMDDAYRRLLDTIISTIERLAAGDAKYGNKLRVENYSALLDAISHHANSVPVLAHFRQRLLQARETAVQGYVREQLEYCRIWALLSFSERLEQLLPDVGPDEVKFQIHFSPDDLSQLLETTMLGADKKLSLMCARIVKHFSQQPPQFVASVWGRCKKALLLQYRRLEEQVALCYPGTTVEPTSKGLRAMLEATMPP